MGTLLIVIGVLTAVVAGITAQGRAYADIGRTGEWWVARETD